MSLIKSACVALATWLAATVPTFGALDYHVRGDLYAYAHNANNGVPIVRDIPAGDHRSVADTATQIGPTGNVATSSYYASLAAGRIGSYVYGYGPHADLYEGGGAHVEATVSMDDRITITVPAGTYDEDLYVTLHGRLDGMITAQGVDGTRESNVHQTWQFSLYAPLGGDGTFNTSTPVYAYPDTSPVVVDQPFTLTGRILYAGTYSSDQTVLVSILASLQARGSALSTYPYGDQVTSVLCDFNNTGQFTALELPEGCTWTSSSGVFMTEIPEPTSSALLLSFAGWLLADRANRRRSGPHCLPKTREIAR